MAQFKADVDMLTTADSGIRPEPPRLIVVHTTENRPGTDPRNVARWQQDTSNQSSYHLLIGSDGTTVRSNDDEYMPWAAMPTGNRIGLHVSLIGQAAMSRGDWIRQAAQLNKLAEVIRKWANDYGIPVRRLTAEAVRAGKWGVCGHAEISAAFKESDHTDPGSGFPWDIVLSRARLDAPSTPPTPPPPATPPAPAAPRDRPVADLILDQLAGWPHERGYPGWDQLNGRTVVDALAEIGQALNIPGYNPPERG